jgi:hypothetical protein
VTIASVFLAHLGASAPVVITMNPAVGEPGDTLTLTGKYFGNKDTSSYVEIGGNRITSSLYISWQDDKIKLVLPLNIDDGLVYVYTKSGHSEPRMFANKQIIPVPAKQNPQITIPIIQSLGASSVSVGNIITINGSNFGELRANSQVYFSTSEINSNLQPVMIACSTSNKDYQYWSATEIQVRVPDGAVSGMINVETNKGMSSGYPIQINTNAGSKTFQNKLTYVLSVNADVADVISERPAFITLFIPKPVVNARQRDMTIQTSEPEPAMNDFMNTIVQQLELDSSSDKKSVAESYVLSVWGVRTNIKEWNVNNYSNLTNTLYSEYLKPDTVTPSENKEIIDLVQSIIKNEKNPWKKARLIYDYMLTNYTVMTNNRPSDANVLDLLNQKSGDVYDYATVYTTLLRAAEIPAVTDAGVLVDSTLTTKNHWWCEFYLEDIGWVPVDPAMGDGYVFGTFKASDTAAADYFAQIDSRHIAFSHGWNVIKPAFRDSKKVYRAKTWALMSIWEESSSDTREYSSFWNDVLVTGVY